MWWPGTGRRHCACGRAGSSPSSRPNLARRTGTSASSTSLPCCRQSRICSLATMTSHGLLRRRPLTVLVCGLARMRARAARRLRVTALSTEMGRATGRPRKNCMLKGSGGWLTGARWWRALWLVLKWLSRLGPRCSRRACRPPQRQCPASWRTSWLKPSFSCGARPRRWTHLGDRCSRRRGRERVWREAPPRRATTPGLELGLGTAAAAGFREAEMWMRAQASAVTALWAASGCPGMRIWKGIRHWRRTQRRRRSGSAIAQRRSGCCRSCWARTRANWSATMGASCARPNASDDGGSGPREMAGRLAPNSILRRTSQSPGPPTRLQLHSLARPPIGPEEEDRMFATRTSSRRSRWSSRRPRLRSEQGRVLWMCLERPAKMDRGRQRP
mmetsp:Transcript_27543/g.88961  ORF Transcript_27543/g.88961 Transcript_27543/m.88961 type:complete len:387 (-) Transcript_27543:1052-2212(-)